MNTQQIIGFINNPSSITEADNISLNELVILFPYFQTVHILLAKYYYTNKHFRFNQALKTAAIYAPGNNRLFELMPPSFNHEHSAILPTKKIEPLPIAPPQQQKVSGNNEVQELYTTHKQALLLIEQRLATLSLKDSYPKMSVSENNIEPPILIEPAAAYDVEIHTAVENNTKEEKLPEVISPKALSDWKTEQHSFLEWLSTKERKITPSTIIENKEEVKNKKKHRTHIIEAFIKNEPRITPAKAQFYSAANMARQSVSENNEIVTETLAKIYVAQGNYQRAISIYENLGLLYPDKIALFAPLIKELNQKKSA